MSRPQQMPAHSKEIQHDAVHGRETLHVGGRLEAPHLPFALARRLMRDFGSIVRVLVGGVGHGQHHGSMSRRITAQLVRDQAPRDGALPFQQLPKEARRGMPIARGRNANLPLAFDQWADRLMVEEPVAPEKTKEETEGPRGWLRLIGV